MADSPYAFSESDLHNIVDKTASAVEELRTVNGIVQAHTEDLGGANQSASGDILQQHLFTWNTDFDKCVNQLNDLNGKAQALLNVNVNVNVDAGGLAQ